MSENTLIRLGSIYLPATPGTPVGRFEFIVDADSGSAVEIGTPVAADTAEGVIVGVVVDMRTIGRMGDPVEVDLAGLYPTELIGRVGEVVLASVQVFHSSQLRPVRAGVVRAASAEEMARATGADRIAWPIPAGVVTMADGSFANVSFDGHALLGPESAHMMIGGLSGQAAKTSYAGVLLKSAISAGSEQKDSVAALVFNVKGEDLIWLDQAPAEGYELTDADRGVYEAMGLEPTPFGDVDVYAPGLPGGGATRSPREDALALRWDLPQVWPYLKYFFPWMYDDEKLMSFLAEFNELCLNNADPSRRVDTFAKLDAWFEEILRNAAENEGGDRMGWRSHHVATVRRIRRMLTALPSRCGGLLSQGASRPDEDVNVTGWSHGRVVVIDIAGLLPDVQSVVIARSIERLLRSAEDGTLGVDHLVVFVDELNAWAPSSGGEMGSVKKILQRLSTQGRYAGLSLWGCGQKLSKVDEMVRDNAATRALGITADGELSAGVYGKLTGGLAERIATLPKGQMALWHYAFRSALVVRFPRPAWRTGKSRTSGASRPSATSVLGLGRRSVQRLVEGIPAETVEQIVAGADDAKTARERLERSRVPDMSKQVVHEPSSFDPSNPFELD